MASNPKKVMFQYSMQRHRSLSCSTSKAFFFILQCSPFLVQVFVEIVAVRNLPDGHKGNLFVLFSKSQPDAFYNAERKLSILSRSGVRQVAYIQCEPTGELFFELVSHSPSKLRITVAPKTMGTASLSLPDFLVPVSKLQVEEWFDLKPSSNNGNSKPIGIRIAVSFTVPTLAPHVLRMVCSRPLSKTACFFFLPERVQHAKRWVDVSNETHSDVITLQMRYDNYQFSGINELIIILGLCMFLLYLLLLLFLCVCT